MPAAPTTGRHEELASLTRLVVEARAGPARIGLICGEAGIGKTRLLDEAAAVAAKHGFEVARTDVQPFDRSTTLAVVRQFARSYVDHPVPVIAQLARSIEAPTGAVDVEAASTITSSLEQLIRALTDRAPLVWLIDDLHDADDDSLHQLGAVVRQVARSRLAVLIAIRDTVPELTPMHAVFVAALCDTRQTTRVPLRPLEPDAVRRICEHHLGTDTASEVLDRVWHACHGNPFFAEEAIRLIVDQDSPDDVTAASRRGVALHRVFRLGHPARMMSRALAVWGTAHLDDLDDLAALAALEHVEAIAGFDVLVNGGVLRRELGERYVFAHPIIRDAIYSDLGPAERRRMHGEVVSLLVARGTDQPMLLAPHIDQSARRGDTAAVSILEAAASDASGVAPRNAIRWLRSALTLLGDDADRHAPIHALLARCQQRIGADGESVQHGRLALELMAPSPERDRAIGVQMIALENLGEFGEALEVSGQLIGERQRESPRILAQRAMLLVHQVRLDDAEALARRALAGAADDHGAAALALSAIGALEYSRGHLARAVEAFSHQNERSRHLPPSAQLHACMLSASYLAYAARLDTASSAIERAQTLISQTGLVGMQPQLDLARLVVDWHAGRWVDARASARCLGERLGEEGRWLLVGFAEAIETAILATTASVSAAGDPPSQSHGKRVVATGFATWATCQWLDSAGRHAEAGQLLETALEHDSRRGRRSMLCMYVAAMADHPTRIDSARRWLTNIEPDTIDAGPWAAAELLRSRAILDDDVESAERGAATADDAGLLLPAARCEIVKARLGMIDVDRLRGTHDALTAVGAERLAVEVAGLLRSAGAHAPRRKREDVLSETDWKLAELVAAGHSNPEIAEKLFLSRKTVETYLSRLYAKLGCRNRVELARAVATGELLVR